MLKDEREEVKVDETKILERWKRELLNEENDFMIEMSICGSTKTKITEVEVTVALKGMKSGSSWPQQE